MTSKTDLDVLRDRVQRLGFFGLLSSWNDIAAEPWLPKLVAIEEQERKRRSLERRLRSARIGAFKSITDYDWSWPKRVDREAIDELNKVIAAPLNPEWEPEDRQFKDQAQRRLRAAVR